MDGKTLLRRVREEIGEPSGSDFLEDQLTFDYLYEASILLVQRAKLITSTQSITTVADQTNYPLNPDFLALYMRNRNNNLFIKYTDSNSSDTFLTHIDYDELIYSNQSTSITIPARFSITDRPTLYSQITGTETSGGTATGYQVTLTDSAGDFSNVYHGDIVHNTTDSSDGIVLSKTSSTVLITALFGGTDADWDSSPPDTYVIQPHGRFDLVLDPPPENASDTVTVYYLQRPAPVYSHYGMYRFAQEYLQHLISYAAAKYKYRDREEDFASVFLTDWEIAVVRTASFANKKMNRHKLTVNMKKRRGRW